MKSRKVRVGSKISFFGTHFDVKRIKSKDEIIVELGNGKEITIWWTDREGCEVLIY